MAYLGTVRFFGDDNNVIALSAGIFPISLLVKLPDERDHIGFLLT
ncbi:MAG: hypothetical protein ACXWT4_00845 [Methylobacter sp.]